MRVLHQRKSTPVGEPRTDGGFGRSGVRLRPSSTKAVGSFGALVPGYTGGGSGRRTPACLLAVTCCTAAPQPVPVPYFVPLNFPLTAMSPRSMNGSDRGLE